MLGGKGCRCDAGWRAQVKGTWQPDFLLVPRGSAGVRAAQVPSPHGCGSLPTLRLVGVLLLPRAGMPGLVPGTVGPRLCPVPAQGAEHTPCCRRGVLPSSPAIACGLCLNPVVKQAPLSCLETQNCLAATPKPPSLGQPVPEPAAQRAGPGAPRGRAGGKWDPPGTPQPGRGSWGEPGSDTITVLRPSQAVARLGGVFRHEWPPVGCRAVVVGQGRRGQGPPAPDTGAVKG